MLKSIEIIGAFCPPILKSIEIYWHGTVPDSLVGAPESGMSAFSESNCPGRCASRHQHLHEPARGQGEGLWASRCALYRCESNLLAETLKTALLANVGLFSILTAPCWFPFCWRCSQLRRFQIPTSTPVGFAFSQIPQATTVAVVPDGSGQFNSLKQEKEPKLAKAMEANNANHMMMRLTELSDHLQWCSGPDEFKDCSCVQTGASL